MPERGVPRVGVEDDVTGKPARNRNTARKCEKLGVALSLSGRYNAALPVLERALEAYRLLLNLEGLS